MKEVKIKLMIAGMVGAGILAIVIAFIFRWQIDRTVTEPIPSSHHAQTSATYKTPLHAETSTVPKQISVPVYAEVTQHTSVKPESPPVLKRNEKQPSPVTAVRIEPEPVSTSMPELTIDEKVQKVIEWFKQTNVFDRPLIERPMKLAEKFKELAQQGDEVSTRVLLAFAGEENGMISSTAISALGMSTNSPLKNDIVKFLREKLKQTRDVGMECTILEGLARLGGDSVADELRTYILNNWRRSDGWGEKVATAVVKGMADVGTYKAGEFLVLELMRADNPDWLYDYGSAVVDALRKYRHPLVKQALLNYADKIRRRMEKEIGAPHEYLKGKLEEVQKAVSEQEQ